MSVNQQDIATMKPFKKNKSKKILNIQNLLYFCCLHDPIPLTTLFTWFIRHPLSPEYIFIVFKS